MHENIYRRTASARRPADHGLGDSDEDGEEVSSSSWERRQNTSSAAVDGRSSGALAGRVRFHALVIQQRSCLPLCGHAQSYKSGSCEEVPST
jgi:hypothetical protein